MPEEPAPAAAYVPGEITAAADAMYAAAPPRENNKILGVHLGHQEVERVVQAIDQLFEFLPQEQYLSDVQVSQLLCQELGYEDVNEFEDAIQGEFKDFLTVMPHIETREELPGEEGGIRLRIKALPPMEERIPTKAVYRINDSEDLWRVCLKSPTATVIIPELEFEIGCDGQRHVDAVYNHLAASIWNLGAHCREDLVDAECDENSEKFKIMATAAALNVLLDVDQPWTFIVMDPDGVSEFRPTGADDGKVIYIQNPGPDCKIGYENVGGFVMRNTGGDEAAQ